MKKTIAAVVLGLFCLTFFSNSAFADYGNDGGGSGKKSSSKKRVSGYVRLLNTKKGLSSAKVVAYNKNGKVVATRKVNSKGKYRFSSLKKGTYVVQAIAAGYKNPYNRSKNSISYTLNVKKNLTRNYYFAR